VAKHRVVSPCNSRWIVRVDRSRATRRARNDWGCSGREPRTSCRTIRGGGEASNSCLHARVQDQGARNPQEPIQVL